MRLFLDENVDGEIFVGVLREAGIEHARMRDLFGRGVPDEDWIPVVARMGLIIVTRDVRTRRNRTELAALVRAEARVLYLRQGTHRGIAQNLGTHTRRWWRSSSGTHRPWRRH